MWLVVLGLAIVILILVILRRTSAFSSNSKIPKIIWTFWDSDDLPPFVQKSIESWRKFSPDFDIRVVTTNTLKDYLPDVDFTSKRNDFIQRTSDFIRVHLVAKYGGMVRCVRSRDPFTRLVD